VVGSRCPAEAFSAIKGREFSMKELSMVEIDIVSGGVMSTKTELVIAAGFILGGPIVGFGMLAGYYVNS
jgi:hypothetical protein